MEQHAIKRYTAEEFFAIPEDGIKRELIDGIIYVNGQPIDHRPLGMAGCSPAHQVALREISGQLWLFLKGKRCQVFTSPLDIQLNLDFEDNTIVEPDIVVICDVSKFDGRIYKGIPDFVVEILSPSTARLDRQIKMRRYERAGIREYWLVDPIARTVQAHLLFNGKYKKTSYSSDDEAAPIMVLENCTINLAEVFAEVDELGA